MKKPKLIKFEKNDEVKKFGEDEQKEYLLDAVKFMKKSCTVVIDGIADIIAERKEKENKDG